jgi:hypothetical protein
MIEAGNVRPKAPTYTDAIPRGGDVLPPLPRDALPAPERAAPPTIEGNPAALEAPRKALPAPTVVEAAMEKVPERPNPLAEYETIEKFESLNDPVAPAVEKAKETLQPLRRTGDNNPPPAFSPVNPEGNLNLRPCITVEQMRGPERQTVESFLSQLKGKPGFTTDSLAEIAAKFDNPRAVVSKSEFESSIPASQFNRVDLIHKGETLAEFNEMVRGEYEEYLPSSFNHYLYDNLDLVFDTDELNALIDFHQGSMPFDELPQEVLDKLEEQHILTEEDLMPVLDEAYEDGFNSLQQRFMEDQGLDENSFGGSKYKYEHVQRLVADPESHNEGYAEFGLTHPEIRDDYYHHMPDYVGENHLGGHWRRTKMPDGGSLITQPTGNNSTIIDRNDLLAKPNSTVIEEIQSDTQQSEKQVGPLRQWIG